MVLLSAQGMDAAAIAKVAFTSEDRVRDVIRNFNADGFASLYPRYRGGGAPKVTLPRRGCGDPDNSGLRAPPWGGRAACAANLRLPSGTRHRARRLWRGDAGRGAA